MNGIFIIYSTVHIQESIAGFGKSMQAAAGYLKTSKKELQADGSYLCEVSIPNREIAAVYMSEILSHLLEIGAVTRTTANKIMDEKINFSKTGGASFDTRSA